MSTIPEVTCVLCGEEVGSANVDADLGTCYECTEIQKTWVEWVGSYGLSIDDYPTPDSWHDLREALEYERVSHIESMTDHEIADNVRCCQWLTDIGNKWQILKG